MSNTNTPQKISIIGAGILGLTCAHVLAQKFGQSTIHIYDSANFPAANASFMAGGMIAPYSELDHMPPRFLPAGQAAIPFWKTLSQTNGVAFPFYENGSLLLAHDHDRHLLHRFQSLVSGHAPCQKIHREELLALEPSFSSTAFAESLFMQNEAHLNPQELMAYLCNALKNKHVNDITPQNEAQNADWVIDCRGMGAEKDDSNLRGVKGEILIVRNPEFSLARTVRLMHPRYPLYIIPRGDNMFMIGATVLESNNKISVSLRSGLELMSALFSLHPSFADAEILDIKAGIRPAYPDNLPHIYVSDRIIKCNGLFRHGYLLAPVMAKCVEALILGEHYEYTNLFLKGNMDGYHLERKIAHG